MEEVFFKVISCGARNRGRRGSITPPLVTQRQLADAVCLFLLSFLYPSTDFSQKNTIFEHFENPRPTGPPL